MWTGDAFCELFKQWDHNLVKLCWFNHIEYLLQLIQKHHLGNDTEDLITHLIQTMSYGKCAQELCALQFVCTILAVHQASLDIQKICSPAIAASYCYRSSLLI